MIRNFFNYYVLLVIFLFFIVFIFFGSLLRHHYSGGDKFQLLQTIAVFFAEIPSNTKYLIQNRTLNLDKIETLKKQNNKNRLTNFLPNKRNAVLVLPRYDHSLGTSVVDILDINNFEVIHTYKHDISAMYNKIKNIKEFPRITIDDSPLRFEYRHPLILEDGSLIADSDYSIEFKIDFCSNLIWINDEEIFSHSKMLDHEGNIWVGGQMNPKSKYVNKYSIQDFSDDSIIKINSDGKILFNKSVLEILIENNILPKNFALNSYLSNEYDPIHLNDIEPAFTNTKYWKKGDIFLSTRHQSSIIHYRPSDNKVINYITGPFAQQHDVDIISDHEISIFNNNNFFVNNEHSEVLIYNFKTGEFRKMFNEQLVKNDVKTLTQGLSHILKDGSLMVEEQNHGRIILFNNKGEKEWEFVNKDKNGDIGFISWSRIIEDESFINKFKSIKESKNCKN